MLLRHARCVLSRLHCIGHSLLLGSYLSRVGRIKNPSCSACGHSSQDTSHLILHCPATDSLATLCLSTTSGPDPGELPGFWGSMAFCHAPIRWKGSGNQQQQRVRKALDNFVMLVLLCSIKYYFGFLFGSSKLGNEFRFVKQILQKPLIDPKYYIYLIL